MSKHLKIVLGKTLLFMVLIGLWNYWVTQSDTESNRDLKSTLIQSVGTGILFGIAIYFFDRPKKTEQTDNQSNP